MPRINKVEEEDRWSRRSDEETSGMSKKILFWGLLLVVIALGAWAISYFDILPGREDSYKAVFLNNGQVYFGKLAKQNSQYPILTDVYYLQVTQPIQGEGSDSEGQQQQQPNVNLVKLGDELHGPTNEMIINRDSILFIEELKSDSQVVKNIKEAKEKE